MSISRDSKSMVKSGDEVNNIFEEIEELLKNSESLEKSTPATKLSPLKPFNDNVTSMSLPNNIGDTKYNNKPTILNTTAVVEELSLNFLQARANYDFLISTDTESAPEEELSLYSVNQNELQPVNAPFMVPGIYKKIANASLASSKHSLQNDVPDSTNVVLMTKCPKGKIISRVDFEGASATDETTENNLNYVEERSLAVAKSCNVGTPSNCLLTFAYNIHKLAKTDCIVIDRGKNEITRIPLRSNDQILYRLLGPEDLNLQINQSIANPTSARDTILSAKAKIGRPRKHTLPNENKQKQEVSCKKLKIEPIAKQEETTKIAPNSQSFTRTRSGRMVKLLTDPQRASDVKQDSIFETINVKTIINESKDKDFQCNVNTITTTEKNNVTEPELTNDTFANHRRGPPNAICPKCGKIFLGRRLNRHFTQHPDHMLAKVAEDPLKQKPDVQIATDNANEDMTLFRYLTTKLQKPLLNEDQRADLFLNELNDLVEQLQLRSTRLIRNTSGLHFVSARTARLLGIPEGQYALDMSAIESEAPFIDAEHSSVNGEERKRHQIMPQVVTVSTPSLDYTAISLDDTLTDEAAQKLNLSAGGKLLPPSEESLLRAVGDLVHDGITKLVDANLLHPPRSVVQSTVTSTLVQQYDHVSDNAVEALTMKEHNAPQEGTSLLDLKVDFFQFKNN
uniref:Zinc finger and BTB domain-containing protein 45 n=2 Tax=Zeugodacus cucurbitae TaxID=28588 RepID=A0A0A1XPP5_ZEUCU